LGLWCQCLVAVAQQLTGAYRPRGPVIEVFGINEAISFPEKFERRGVKLEVLRRSLDQKGQAAAQVGARWRSSDAAMQCSLLPMVGALREYKHLILLD